MEYTYYPGCSLEVSFRGYGTCVASCPSSAATAKHFSDEQILAEIEGILE